MRPLVMGVLNVTPDSFSDGGIYLDRDRAIEHGLELIAAGADVVDVGGESTRPGAEPVGEDEEIKRVVPVVAELSGKVRVSVDTTKKAVAVASIEAGATLVNDVSASLWEVAAEAGAGWVAMHMQGVPRTMQANPSYGDVVSDVHGFLLDRAETAGSGGCDRNLAGSRDRLRQDGGAQSDAAPPSSGSGRNRVPGPRRHEPQELPREGRPSERRVCCAG